MHSESGVRGLRRHVADVIVVGGGGSGLAAASAAASAGAKTIVLEKNTHLGGTTRLSVGSITASGTRFQKSKGIHDTPDEHFSDMSLFLTPELAVKENLELRRVLVDHIPETPEWLIGIGLSFYGPMPEPPHQKPRMHNVLPNSRAYPYYLSRECRRLGVDIQAGVRAQSLIVDNGEVVGLVASNASGPVEYFARSGVVLASGDFSASFALKAQNLPHVAHVDAVNPASTGDGHAIAASVGAWIRNPDVMWGPSMRFKAPAQETLLKRLPPHRAPDRADGLRAGLFAASDVQTVHYPVHDLVAGAGAGFVQGGRDAGQPQRRALRRRARQAGAEGP
ncbi:FAD-dependent oxidoreductase [Caballeronia sp. TF1N1]|uniref:FAD-dependent oxidoreductase n=1 Tax=Caballeronia sp. TF1N1 TaxID=2878153 RepID=UPI001FD13D11|nr:FAD-dependent oxidoreductase [Caballeronia sp. TF1N1]